MKDFLELIGSERPNLSDPQWLGRLYIPVKMTRHLDTTNLRLQGNKGALLVRSKKGAAASVWPCGLSRWQLRMASLPMPENSGLRIFTKFEEFKMNW